MAKTSISALQEFLQKRRSSAPLYTDIALGYGNTPTFRIRCECEGLRADGEASNKKTAKHRAAGAMIKLLHKKYNYQIYYEDAESAPSSPAPRSYFSPVEPISPVSPVSGSTINHVGKLQELCAVRKIRQPEYRESNVFGPSHMPQFTVECRIAHYKVSRTAPTKKQAKQDAAAAMRELLKAERIVTEIPTIPSVPQDDSSIAKDLELNLEDLKIPEDPKLATATERARAMYPALKKSRGVVSDTPKGISIAEYHEAFKASFDPEVVERFHIYYKSLNMIDNHSRIELEAILQHICSTLGVTYEKHRLQVVQTAVYVIVYKLKSEPPYTEAGMGSEPEVAHIDALRRLIGAIYVMLV